LRHDIRLIVPKDIDHAFFLTTDMPLALIAVASKDGGDCIRCERVFQRRHQARDRGCGGRPVEAEIELASFGVSDGCRAASNKDRGGALSITRRRIEFLERCSSRYPRRPLDRRETVTKGCRVVHGRRARPRPGREIHSSEPASPDPVWTDGGGGELLGTIRPSSLISNHNCE